MSNGSPVGVLGVEGQASGNLATESLSASWLPFGISDDSAAGSITNSATPSQERLNGLHEADKCHWRGSLDTWPLMMQMQATGLLHALRLVLWLQYMHLHSGWAWAAHSLPLQMLWAVHSHATHRGWWHGRRLREECAAC